MTSASNYARTWNAMVTAFTEAGLSVGEAARWVHARGVHDYGQTFTAVSSATDYLDHRIPLQLGYQWARHGFIAEVAHTWIANGWHPRHTQALYDVYGWARTWGKGQSPEPYDWLTASIRHDWAVRYAAAGYTPEEAEHLEQQRLAGDHTIGPALALLAALREDHS